MIQWQRFDFCNMLEVKETRTDEFWDVRFKIQMLLKDDTEVFSRWFDVTDVLSDILK